MKVREIMTSEVLTLKADDPVRNAAELVETKGLRRFPVVDSTGALVGILTDRDLKNATASSIVLTQKKSHDFLLDSTRIETLMTADPKTVTPDTAVEDAAKTILSLKVGGLPVVEVGKLVGIVTETDLIYALLKLLSSE